MTSNQSADSGLKVPAPTTPRWPPRCEDRAQSVTKEIRSFLPSEEGLAISLKRSSEVIRVTSLGAQDAAPHPPSPSPVLRKLSHREIKKIAGGSQRKGGGGGAPRKSLEPSRRVFSQGRNRTGFHGNPNLVASQSRGFMEKQYQKEKNLVPTFISPKA